MNITSIKRINLISFKGMRRVFMLEDLTLAKVLLNNELIEKTEQLQ